MSRTYGPSSPKSPPPSKLTTNGLSNRFDTPNCVSGNFASSTEIAARSTGQSQLTDTLPPSGFASLTRPNRSIRFQTGPTNPQFRSWPAATAGPPTEGHLSCNNGSKGLTPEPSHSKFIVSTPTNNLSRTPPFLLLCLQLWGLPPKGRIQRRC